MAINNESVKEARNNLAGGLNAVIQDAENLPDTTEDNREGRYKLAREKLKSTLQTARSELPKVTQKAVAKSKYAAQVTDEYVGDNPWKAVSVAAAIGLLVGVVIGRSK